MAYTLDQFCTETRSLLQDGPPDTDRLAAIAANLTSLLRNAAFIAATFEGQEDFSKRVLHHDVDTDFYVLAHVHHGPKEGPPHSHGASWAVYGTAMGVTGMKEWKRVGDASEDAYALAMSDRYDLGVGDTRGYGPHAIHSTIHPAKAWVIRVTGTDLDKLPRYRFKRGRDRLVEDA